LNLKNEAGRSVFRRLVKRSDVVVENFAPGAMDRLGLGPSALQAINPKLVFASSSGYGSTGPYRDFPAMDLTMQAMSGVMSITGMPDGPPVKAGPALCDFLGGIHLYGAIVTALYKKAVTGEGSVVEVSMMDSVYPSLLSNLGLHALGDRGVKRTGNRHGGLTIAPYNVYPTADGEIAILVVADAHWQNLAAVLKQPQWLNDPRFCDKSSRVRHMDALDHDIAAVTRTYAKAELFRQLIDARVPCAPVRELDEVVNDAHLHQTGMLQWVEHPMYGRILIHGSPLKFKGVDAPAYRLSAALGEDTHAILSEVLGLGVADVRALADAGAFS